MEAQTLQVCQCRKCEKYGLAFTRYYQPSEFAEGDPESDIWLVSINPRGDRAKRDTRTRRQLLESVAGTCFEDFSRVSEKLSLRMGFLGKGVCQTYAYRCYSEGAVWKVREEWINNLREICRNCSQHLADQIDRHSHNIKMILCNGTKAVDAVEKALVGCGFAIGFDNFTSTEYLRDGHHIFVVNSGFVTRIDNFAKRRLGIEIEQIAERAGVQL